MPFHFSAPQIAAQCAAANDSDIAAVQATPTIPAEPACIATDSGVHEASTLKEGDATRPGSNFLVAVRFVLTTKSFCFRQIAVLRTRMQLATPACCVISAVS